MAAVRCAAFKSPRRNPSRRKAPLGRLDQRTFCASSVSWNWTFDRCPSASVATNAAAFDTTCDVAEVASEVACCAASTPAQQNNTENIPASFINPSLPLV